jgi:glycosyltransferase involved in cell wall biosynthesis
MNDQRQQRVLYVQKSQDGGSTLSLYELLKGLNWQSYKPLVLFYAPNTYTKNFQMLGVETITLFNRLPALSARRSKRDIAKKLESYSSSASNGYRNAKQIYLFAKDDLSTILRIARIIKNESIDIIHHNNSLPRNRSAIIAAKINNIPQVCHIRMFHGLSIVEKCLARWVHSFIYISKAIKQSYVRQGIPPAKGSVIFNPVNDEVTVAKEQVVQIRNQFELTKQGRLIINVGRLDWWKGHDYFIKAISIVIKSEPHIKALIVGPVVTTPICQDYYNRLLKMVAEMKLSRHIIFTGFRSDIPHIMAASDIVVHSSSEPEPFGRVVVEGMLAGRPVIATAGGGVLDIIEDKVTGLLVPMKDPDAMAKAIKYLLKSPEEAQRIGLQAQMSAKTRFNVNKHVKAVQNIYENILRTDSPSNE